jgi:hypothetical protein
VVTRLGIVVLLSLLAAAGPVGANVLDLYGAENVGTSGGQFLKIPVGPRAVAMGKAYIAIAIDGPTVFWNPAGIMRTAGRSNVFASHVAYTTDLDLDYASFHWRNQNFGYAISAGMLRSGEIPRTTELHVEGTGETFRADQYLLALSLSRAMTDRLSLGVTAKYLQENLDEWETRTLLFDVGMLYYIGVRDLAVGFAVRSLGSDLQPSGRPPSPGSDYETATEFQTNAPPTEGTFGVAGTWDLAPQIDLLTAVDFNHPSDARESFRCGVELGLRRLLYLRAGYETGRDEGGIGAGFGLQLKRKQMLWRVDYGYSDMGGFGTIHHIGLEFSPLWAKEAKRHGRAR